MLEYLSAAKPAVEANDSLGTNRFQQESLHKKWSFRLKIFPVNVTKIIFKGKLHFLCSELSCLSIFWVIVTSS